MNTKLEFHGSDIEKVCEHYGLKKEDIVNFGANVNPLGLSEQVKKALATHLDLLSSYPDRSYTSLRNILSTYCQIPADFILPGNGSSELISLLIEERRPKHTMILGPTYSEYSRELGFSDSTIDCFYLKPEQDFQLSVEELCLALAKKQIDFLILCNPNNPTSSVIFHPELIKLLEFCQDHNIFVMIDETYVEFAPDVDAVTAVPLTQNFQNLMVLRGVSKFFAAPGMRFGYGITGNAEFLKKLKSKQIPWSLNSLGAFAGELLFQDKEYIKKTRNLILSEREYMYTKLRELPFFYVYPAYANFLLVQIQKDGLTSSDVFEACIREGLMIRDCSSFTGLEGEFVRFCIMDPEDNRRLLTVFQKISQSARKQVCIYIQRTSTMKESNIPCQQNMKCCFFLYINSLFPVFF